MKNIISNLISAAATSIVVMIFGIPMLTALAVMVAFLLMKKIVEVIYEHISEKKMPSISQWVEYSLLLVAFILIVCGINYSSISSVNLKIGLVERLCKVGDIYIVADNKKYILEDIKDPYFIYERLQKIANDIKSDIIYPNNYRPKENYGYKTSYKHKNDKKM